MITKSTQGPVEGTQSRRAAIALRTAVPVVAVGLGFLAAINPLLALGAFLAVAALFVFLPRGDLAVAAFAATTYFEVAVEYTGTTATPIKFVGAAVVATAALRILVPARPAPPAVWNNHPRLLVASLAFVAWGAASIGWAVDLAQVKSLSIRLLTDALVFVSVPLLLRRTRDLRLLGWTVVVASLASAAIGVLFDYDVDGRAIGAFFDPNEFAVATVVGAAFAIALGESTSSRSLRWLARAAASLALVATVASASRTGVLAACVAFLVLVATARGVERVRMTGILAIGVALVAAWVMLAPGGSAAGQRLGGADSTGRTDLWRVALYQFADEPIHGVGLGNYPVLSVRYLRADVENVDLFVGQPRTVHNTPLELLSELGIVGFVLFYALTIGCIVVLVRALRRARSSGDVQLVGACRGILAGLAALLASSLTLSSIYVELQWILFGACMAAASLARESYPAAVGDDARELAGLPVPAPPTPARVDPAIF